jgi:hypothetical protein
MGLAVEWLKKQLGDKVALWHDHNWERLTLRIYNIDGQGCHFIRNHSPGKWYYDDDPSDGNFCNTTMEKVSDAVKAGGMVQLTGDREKSYGTWKNWEEFEKAVSL